jgi:hypothetical protein
MLQIAKSTKFIIFDLLLIILTVNDDVLFYLKIVILFIYNTNDCIFITSQSCQFNHND